MSEQNKNSAKGKNAKKLAAEKAQRSSLLRTVGTVAIVCVVVIAMVVLLVSDKGAYNIDYSKGLTDDGKIENVNVLDYIDAFEYKNLSVAASEVNPSEEEVKDKIEAALDDFKEYIEASEEESNYAVSMGEEVSVVYTMYLDGNVVEEESVEEAVDVKLGDEVYEFEADLDGAILGETVKVDCVMPEDYSNEDVAGKTVSYEVELLGHYILPELTDEFVKENLLDTVSTIEEYEEHIKQSLLEANIDEFVANFLQETVSANSYPKKYLNILIDNADLDYRYMYEYYNSYYYSIYGGYLWDSFYDFVESYYGYSRSEYEEQLESDMKESLEYYMSVMYIFEDMGLEMSDEAIKEALGYDDEGLADAIELYGRGDLARSTMESMVLDALADSVTIE